MAGAQDAHRQLLRWLKGRAEEPPLELPAPLAGTARVTFEGLRPAEQLDFLQQLADIVLYGTQAGETALAATQRLLAEWQSGGRPSSAPEPGAVRRELILFGPADAHEHREDPTWREVQTWLADVRHAAVRGLRLVVDGVVLTVHAGPEAGLFRVVLGAERGELRLVDYSRGARLSPEEGEPAYLFVSRSNAEAALVQHFTASGPDPKLTWLDSACTPRLGADDRLRRTRGPLDAVRGRVSRAIVEAIEREDLSTLRARVTSRESATAHLLHAVRAGSLATVKLLLGAGADPNVWDREPHQGMSLHFAEDCGILDALLEAGADLEAATDDGATPLIEAVTARRLDVVARLLSAGAAVTATTFAGSSALHRAASSGDTEIARVLLAAGADLFALDSKGQTPMDRARSRGREDVLALLEQSRGADLGE